MQGMHLTTSLLYDIAACQLACKQAWSVGKWDKGKHHPSMNGTNRRTPEHNEHPEAHHLWSNDIDFVAISEVRIDVVTHESNFE